MKEKELRCIDCKHFKPTEPDPLGLLNLEGGGYCKFHSLVLLADSHHCKWFERCTNGSDVNE